jgi:4-amino-4-deoxy-L-arabinose transferase-like glycosyltransferase
VTNSPPPRGLRILVGLAVLFALAQAGYSAWDEGWAIDERVHLEWSRRLLTTGEDERESRPRFDSKTPIVMPNVLAMKAAQAAGATLEGQRFVARLPTILCLAALLLATFHLARSLFGPAAACLATLAAALDPNLAASASIVTVDLVHALGVVLTASAALRFVQAPSPRTAVLFGLALGLVFTAKFSAVLLLPGLVLLPFLGPRPPEGRSSRAFLTGLLVAGGVAIAVLCAAYLFVKVAVPLGRLPLASRPLGLLARLAPGLRLPLPASFLTGIDHSIVRDGGVWPVYVLGAFHPRPVWYYFPFHWVLKTPLGLLLLEIVGFIGLLRYGILQRSGGARFVAAILLCHLAFFSLLFRTQIGYRFVLMCVPLGYVLAAGGLPSLLGARGWRIAAAAAVALAVIENAVYWGNPFAFTNAAVWPKRSAWRLMADSSLDYGQDRERIARWLAGTDSALNPVHILPGRDVINLNAFVGLPDPERYRWLRERVPPAGHVGYTHLVWQIDDGTYDRYMDEERRLLPTAAAAALCGSGVDLVHHPVGSSVPLELIEGPDTVRAFVACASVRKTTDFALHAEGGGFVRFGAYRDTPQGPACAAGEVQEGQSSWYRLEPGLHALCLEEVANARPWLPYRFRGHWGTRGNGVRFALRERPPAAPR